MAPREIIFSPNSEKEIKRLPRDCQKSILGSLKRWRTGELVPEIEKIKTQPDFFRVRFGNFRVVYYPLGPERVVLLLIRDRKDAYRNLGDLGTKLETAMRKLKIVGGRR